MAQAPLISVLIPVKNGEKFLEECLKSIIEQQYSNWEAIVVNDHSIDRTEKILKSFTSLHKNITYYQNPGSGIIDALNTAYRKAKGQFISRMDADDIMPPYKLKVLYDLLKDQNIKNVIVTGKVSYFSTNKSLQNGFKRYEKWLNMLCDTNSHYNDIYKECIIASPNWLIHKDTLEKAGGICNDIYPEDYDLCFRLYQHKIKIVSSRRITHLWRDHIERASRNDPHYTDNRFLDLKLNYFLYIDYTKDRELVLWGAGNKGKLIARILLQKNIPFNWLSNNRNKIGHNIYGITLQSEDSDVVKHNQVIIATTQDHDIIKKHLDRENAEKYFFI